MVATRGRAPEDAPVRAVVPAPTGVASAASRNIGVTGRRE